MYFPAPGFIAPLLREQEPRRLFNIISSLQYIIPQQILVYLQTRLRYIERDEEWEQGGWESGKGRRAGGTWQFLWIQIIDANRHKERQIFTVKLLSFTSWCQANSMTVTRLWPVFRAPVCPLGRTQRRCPSLSLLSKGWSHHSQVLRDWEANIQLLKGNISLCTSEKRKNSNKKTITLTPKSSYFMWEKAYSNGCNLSRSGLHVNPALQTIIINIRWETHCLFVPNNAKHRSLVSVSSVHIYLFFLVLHWILNGR